MSQHGLSDDAKVKVQEHWWHRKKKVTLLHGKVETLQALPSFSTSEFHRIWDILCQVMSSLFDQVQLSAKGPIGLPEQHCERVPTFPMAPRRLRTGRNLNASWDGVLCPLVEHCAHFQKAVKGMRHRLARCESRFCTQQQSQQQSLMKSAPCCEQSKYHWLSS